MSPCQLSLRHLRKTYPLVGVTEHWNAFARIRQDLFGCIDMLAIGPDILAVQTTSATNISVRVRKLNASPALPHLRAAGIRVLIHGWRKNAEGRWTLREVSL